MIQVSIKESAGVFTLKVTGHAGAAEAGKDLVCAAASMLTYTLAQTADFMRHEKKLRRKPVFNRESGSAELIVKPKSRYAEEARIAFSTIENGFLLLQGNYPDYVSVGRKA